MAGIAQLVEQRTENPRVTSSNLVLGTYLLYEYIEYILQINQYGLIYIFITSRDHDTYINYLVSYRPRYPIYP